MLTKQQEMLRITLLPVKTRRCGYYRHTHACCERDWLMRLWSDTKYWGVVLNLATGILEFYKKLYRKINTNNSRLCLNWCCSASPRRECINVYLTPVILDHHQLWHRLSSMTTTVWLMRGGFVEVFCLFHSSMITSFNPLRCKCRTIIWLIFPHVMYRLKSCNKMI